MRLISAMRNRRRNTWITATEIRTSEQVARRRRGLDRQGGHRVGISGSQVWLPQDRQPAVMGFENRSPSPARRRRHQGILSVDAGAAGIRRWCLSAQPSNWRGGPVRRRGRREMEIPARQYVVGTPGIVAHQRAVVDVRGQAPWRSVIGFGVTCRGKKPTRGPKQPFEAFAPPVRGANQSGLWSG
jgi:hypothetical protein